MKKVIRWALNHIPRPVLQRIAGWAVPVAGLFYRGRGAECPVCGAKYRKFLPYGYVRPRPNALCPRCLSLERHRSCRLYLTRETDLLKSHPPHSASPGGLHHAPPETPLRGPARQVRHGRSRKPARGPAFRRAADSARRQFGGRRPLQPPAGTRGRRPPRPARAAPHPAPRRVGHRPLARGTQITRRTLQRRSSPIRRAHASSASTTTGASRRGLYRPSAKPGFEAADIDYAASLPEEERRLYALPDDHIYVVYKH